MRLKQVEVERSAVGGQATRLKRHRSARPEKISREQPWRAPPADILDTTIRWPALAAYDRQGDKSFRVRWAQSSSASSHVCPRARTTPRRNVRLAARTSRC